MCDPRLKRIRSLERMYSALQSDLPFLDERIDLLRGVIAEPRVGDDDHSKQQPPSPRPFITGLQRDLGFALYTRFHHTRDIIDLDEAQECLRGALQNGPRGAEISFPSASSLLGSVLRERLRELEVNEERGVEEALMLHRESLEDSHDLPCLVKAYHSRELGLTLRLHHRLVQADVSLISEGIELLRSAKRLFTDAGVEDLHSTLGLGLALLEVCAVMQGGSSLEDALSLCREAVASCSIYSRDFYMARYTFAAVLRTSAWLLNDTSAMDEAINTLRESLQAAPFGWAQMLIYVIARSLILRFSKHGNHEDVSEAITILSSHLALVNATHKTWGDLQTTLSYAFYMRFTATGAPEDIEEATRAVKSALRTDSSGTLHLSRLNSLAECRMEQYKAFGDMAHLDECIDVLEQIDRSVSSEGELGQFAVANLLEALGLRYKHAGDSGSLHKAVRLIETSEMYWNKKSMNASKLVGNAGDILLSCFALSGSSHDLEQATAFHQQAAEMCANEVDTHHDNILKYARTLSQFFAFITSYITCPRHYISALQSELWLH
jgi:tetratricopeptide (TPR) repeat protein